MKTHQTQLIQTLFKAVLQQPKLLQITLFWLPTLSGLALILGGIGYFYETKIARPHMAYMGVPITQNDWQNLTHTLRNEGFMLGYSEKLANPLWVTYKVTQTKLNYGKRPQFETDWRSIAQIKYHDYSRSGYDRGHMAPNYVIASRYGKNAQQDTFLMTNITPQKPTFNQKIWQRLEEVSADHFSKQFKQFWVITGPIFSANPKQLKNAPVAIPKAFYKIFVLPQTEESPPKTLAFIMPQTAKPRESLMKFVTTVDEVEKQTGIDFFWQLPDDIENTLEASENDPAWQLEKVANLAGRYE